MGKVKRRVTPIISERNRPVNSPTITCPDTIAPYDVAFAFVPSGPRFWPLRYTLKQRPRRRWSDASCNRRIAVVRIRIGAIKPHVAHAPRKTRRRSPANPSCIGTSYEPKQRVEDF
jgi:hypothetical protein